MERRGYGKARNKAEGGFIDPAPTKAPEVDAKPSFMLQRVNRSKTRHTPINAVNLNHTQRKAWKKLG
jgi:hypothetical protein